MAKQKNTSPKSKPLPEIAFYYPGPLWHSGSQIKTLLLFFDGIALLVPKYMRDRPEEAAPYLATPLREAGLLHILEPESLVDKSATRKLSEALTPIIKSGAFDKLGKAGIEYHELSYSRLGVFGDPKVAETIVEELMSRGLAKKSKDGVSIPLHPMVRYLILVLLAQILIPKGRELGLDLSPTTDWPEIVQSLTDFLSLPSMPSSGSVVAFDLETIAPNLSSVPLDEILDFRQQYLKEYQAYIRAVRQFVREVGITPLDQRARAFQDRQEDLRDLAAGLKNQSRKSWKKPASFALGLAGAVWTLKTGDRMGAALAGGALLAGGIEKEKQETGAFSYLFNAHERFR